MKDLRIKDLDKFLEKTAQIETPFKIYQQSGDNLQAICHCRILMISWEGKNTGENRSKLERDEYAEGKLLETKRWEIFT